MKLFALILAGGSGTRFWPESVEAKPKQYLTLFGDKSLLANTLLRFENFIPKNERFIVTIKRQLPLAINEAQSFIKDSQSIIVEPSARNTAPCIMLAMAKLEASGMKEDDVVVIVPSDHIILNTEGFQKTITDASRVSSLKNKIVTIGITPHFPHTGFGYIEKGEMVEAESFNVKKFKEKPAFELAREYVASGKFLWNAGMFVAKLSVLKSEFQKHAPDMFKHYNDLKNSIADEAAVTKIYEQLPKDSFDYVVMEKSSEVLVVPAQFDWNDLGSWDALGSVLSETDNNIVGLDKGHFFYNATDNIVFAPNHFVSLLHVKDLIVVVNDKSVMVLPKEMSQDVKKVVEHLKVNRQDLL